VNTNYKNFEIEDEEWKISSDKLMYENQYTVNNKDMSVRCYFSFLIPHIFFVLSKKNNLTKEEFFEICSDKVLNEIEKYIDENKIQHDKSFILKYNYITDKFDLENDQSFSIVKNDDDNKN